MLNPVLLIDEDYIKQNSVIERNVDGKLLRVTIDSTMTNVLMPVLGPTLYNTVIDHAIAQVRPVSPVAVPEPYRELIYDYIQPYLLHATVRDFLFPNNYKVSNSGIQKLRTENGDNLTSQELENLKNIFDARENSFKGLLIKFLQDNKLVEFCDAIDTDTTTNVSGWFLD